MQTRQRKILTLRQKIRQLEDQLPAHSMPSAMLQALEDLEDELTEEIRKLELEEGLDA
jgi:hypothetical protein